MNKSDESEGQARRVAIIGGGLAGLAAAVILAERGWKVDLFEEKRRLGGRVGSFHDTHSGQLVDYSAHVAMGCCTNFLDFIRRAGVAELFARHRRLHFIGPAGEVCRFHSWPWLPAPLHLLPGFGRLRYLGLHDRLSIGRCLMALGRLEPENDWANTTAGDWLRSQGQSSAAIDRFWSVVLLSALGETVDRAGLAMARKVFLDGFLRSSRSYEILLPVAPLREIFDRRIGERLRQLGVEVHRAARVQSLGITRQRAESLVLSDGTRHTFDDVVVAVPWKAVGRLLSPEQRSLLHAGWTADRIEPAAITALHLWFDRPITHLPHAALVGRTSQWIFRRPAVWENSLVPSGSHYLQVVISAAGQLAVPPRARLVEHVCGELACLGPAAQGARLLHHRVVTQRDAVFSVTPESVLHRPQPRTGVANLCLAGDWVANGWPATMEGAIRSGYQAARALLENRGVAIPLPLGDLPPGWLAKRLFA